MQIRDSVKSDWNHFYDKIHGFTHESGFDHHLKVLITDVKNLPADASLSSASDRRLRAFGGKNRGGVRNHQIANNAGALELSSLEGLILISS